MEASFWEISDGLRLASLVAVRNVIVVDADVDVHNLNEVLWRATGLQSRRSDG